MIIIIIALERKAASPERVRDAFKVINGCKKKKIVFEIFF